jgi:hypothetical protein
VSLGCVKGFVMLNYFVGASICTCYVPGGCFLGDVDLMKTEWIGCTNI